MGIHASGISISLSLWTEILKFFLTSHVDFLFIFGQGGDNCKQNMFLEKKLESANVQDR